MTNLTTQNKWSDQQSGTPDPVDLLSLHTATESLPLHNYLLTVIPVVQYFQINNEYSYQTAGMSCCAGILSSIGNDI